MNNNGFWQGVLLWVKLFLVLACGFFLILIMPTLGFDTSGNFKHTPGAITIMVVVCSMLNLVYMGHCIKPHSDMCSVALQMPFPLRFIENYRKTPFLNLTIIYTSSQFSYHRA